MTAALAHRLALWALAAVFSVEGALIASKYRALRSLQDAQARRHVTAIAVSAASAAPRAPVQAPGPKSAVRRQALAPRTDQALAAGGVLILKALENPRFREDLSIIDRNFNRREVVPFLRTLDLSPDQIEHALDLIGQLMIAKTDAEQTASTRYLSSPEREAVAAQTEQDLLEQLHSALGDPRFTSYQQWLAQGAVRSMVANLRDRLSYTSQPLTDAQTAELVQVVYQVSPDHLAPLLTGRGALEPTMPKGRYFDITPAELGAAKAVLTPGQMAAYRELAKNQTAAIQFGAVMH